MPIRLAFLAFAAFLLENRPSILWAQTTTLTLTDCLRLAEEHSPVSAEGRLSRLQAEGARNEAKRQLLPSIAALGGLTGTNNVNYAPILDNSENAAVDVRFTGFPFSSAWTLKDQRSSELSAARYSQEEARQETERTVKELYFGALEQIDAIATIERVSGTLQGLLDTIIPRYSMGRAPPFDAVKVRVSISDLARSRGLAEADLAEEKNRLSLLIGLKSGSEFGLSALTAFPDFPSGSQAWADNPALQALSQGVRTAQIELRAAQFARYPELIGDFQYGYTGLTLEHTTLGYVGSLGLRLNIFDWGAISAQESQQETKVALIQIRLQAAEQDAESGWISAQAQAKAYRDDLERVRNLLPSVHEAAQSSIERYKRGATGILEATDAIDLWLQTQLNESSAYYSYLSALARLEQLSGDELKIDYGR